MKCTFEHETCSSYGERVIQEHGVLQGIKLIRKRQKRCEAYKLFAFDENTIGWEKGFKHIMDKGTEDDISNLVEQLHADDEKKEAIGHILNGAQIVHKYVYNEPSTILESYIEKEKVQDIKPQIRNANGYTNVLKKKLLSSFVIAGGIELLTIGDTIHDHFVHVAASLYVASAWFQYLKKKRFFDYFASIGILKA